MVLIDGVDYLLLISMGSSVNAVDTGISKEYELNTVSFSVLYSTNVLLLLVNNQCRFSLLVGCSLLFIVLMIHEDAAGMPVTLLQWRDKGNSKLPGDDRRKLISRYRTALYVQHQ